MTTKTTILLLTILITITDRTVSDPQTNLLNIGCSQYNASNPADFISKLNQTFSDLRSQINASTRFATAQRPPVYSLFQCRPYLSTSDCLACLSVAVSRIRNCSGNGARVIFDGCFLRYESNSFFDQTTLPGNVGLCSNRTVAAGAAAFDSAAVTLLSDLAEATPKIRGYFAAAEGGGGTAVYGAAQCAETVSESGCGDCLAVALGNIKSCPPDAEGRAVDAGCFLRYSVSAFFDSNQTVDLAPYLTSGSSSKNKTAIIGGVVGGVGGGLLIVGVLWAIWITRFRKPKGTERGDILGATELRGPMNFRYKDLKVSTKNFSEENKLGEGGFGGVYKGVLKNGKTVAVKRLSISQTGRVLTNFQSEVKLISNVHHRNLIRLLGCCSKGPELLLVYEYMAKSSLDRHLFGDNHGSLNWKQRFDIIVGTARGLAYLHEEFHVCIIHRDIKSSNILLDDDFLPRIADFGLARLLPEDHSHLTTRFAGTLGYTAPEYAIHGQLSEKVDTYSYGVVVLEIISGRKSNDIKLEAVSQYLLEWAWKLYEEDRLMELVDATLDPKDYKADELKRIMEIALLCTQSTVSARPTMSEVVVMLLSKGNVGIQPTRPTFIDATSRVRGDTSTSTSSANSNATLSISQFSAR
ncbi:Cysteine-rich receptor-like protein kinase 2 [Acorus gramineus]|uniref:Cysteine-rich receptor-like protein kinase 2 n=1 Tax=Acorus gramineus TaxID=55184 RepID=A0AAV9BBW0_ACOGR|nr:Cysteine-rich receptor-like protein kinase 2 [Acorus gramineus]